MIHPDHIRQVQPRWTDDANEQRARSLSFYHHLKIFTETMGEDWNIVGAQGFGDLTMNLWHLAIINKDQLHQNQKTFARLEFKKDQKFVEDWTSNQYVALVVHKDGLIKFHDVTFVQRNRGLPIICFDGNDADMGKDIRLLLVAKPIVRNNIVLPLQTTINMFQDIRHIFACVRCPLQQMTKIHGKDTESIIFGEKDLYNDINKRRQALSSALQINLEVSPGVNIEPKMLTAVLKKEGYSIAEGLTPDRPGLFKMLTETTGNDEKVDIFFKRNYYPFSAIGVKHSIDGNPTNTIVCLCSTGQQFRIGDTVEGIAHKMAEYGNCSDALIMDEGFDVFQMANIDDHSNLKFENDEILKITAQHMSDMLAADDSKARDKEAKKEPYISLRDIHGNREMIIDIDNQMQNVDHDDLRKKVTELYPVAPQRFQTRAILIFAVKKQSSEVKSSDKMNISKKNNLVT